MPVSKHIHRYIRGKLGNKTIYKCNIAGCTHFVFKELIENRQAICNRCGERFIITKALLKTAPAKPHCENCTHYRKEETKNTVVEDKVMEDALDALLKSKGIE